VIRHYRNRHLNWKRTFAACACLATAGCVIGPKYTRPPIQAPPAYKESQVAGNAEWKAANPSEGVLRGKWWELFGDPQLDRLEEMVSVSNQNLKAAEAQYQEARAVVALNRANYYPTITTNPSINSAYTPRNMGGRQSGTTTTYTLPAGATWEPDLWHRVRLSVENATASAQASAADIENVRLSMQTTLASDYFQLAGNDMQQRLLADTIAGYEKALELTLNRFNGGVAAKTDVVQARTQLESARAQLTDLGIARAQFEHAIAVLAGRPPAELSLAVVKIQGPPPPIPAGLPSDLLQRRPDIAAAERQVAAANAEIGLAKTAFYPSLLLSATAGLESTSFLNWIAWPSRFFSAGPALSQTLFDFGRRKAQVRESEAAYDALAATYRQTVLSGFQEVEDNLAAIRQLSQEAAQQDAAVKAAEESLNLETDLYKGGTVSYLNVITTQTIAFSNEITAVTILTRRMVSSVQLIGALGGGWDASSLPLPASMRSAAAPSPTPTAPQAANAKP
jgi:NodT family efflux transporter outer membrane factor (OMF) lipoprotein